MEELGGSGSGGANEAKVCLNHIQALPQETDTKERLAVSGFPEGCIFPS